MKYTILFFICLISMQCSNEILTVNATIVHIEPFALATPLMGEAEIKYKQPAWIKLADSKDSIAILFDSRISGGDDIAKKISIGKSYRFELKKYEQTRRINKITQSSEKSDSVGKRINSLPNVYIIDSTKAIKANQFWLVLRIDEL